MVLYKSITQSLMRRFDLSNEGRRAPSRPKTRSYSRRISLLSSRTNFNSTDGFSPIGNLIFNRSGNLYGTTDGGGTSGDGKFGYGYGVVFEVTP
jgi:hypothetical protein